MTNKAAANVAQNIRQLRELRGWTQRRLAELSGVPRATWAHLESGSANPTLAVMIKAASAFQVSIDELIHPPRTSVRLARAEDLVVQRRSAVTITKMLPDGNPSLEVDRFHLPAGSRMSGVPHTPGTREYLCCERGQVTVRLGGEAHKVSAGQVLLFRGDQRHGYHNQGDVEAVAYSVVALAPTARP